MRKISTISFITTITLILASCGGTSIPPNPINGLMENLSNKGSYTITLDDMDLKGDQYEHKYKIYQIESDSSVTISYSGRVKVSDDFFMLHENDMGMEVVSKTDNGAINSLISPPGFTNFVGNKNFGEWKEFYLDTLSVMIYEDSTFWVFNENHSNLASALGIQGLNISLKEYRTFQEDYLFNRPFYGPKTAPDSTKYGTRSPHRVRYYPLFYSRRALHGNFYKRYSSSSTGSRGGGGFGK